MFSLLRWGVHTTTLTCIATCFLTSTIIHQHCPLWLHYSHQQRLFASRRTHRTVSHWAALIETAYVLSQAKWIGRDGREKKTQLTKHYIKVWQNRLSHVTKLLAVSHIHAISLHMHHFLFKTCFVMNIPRWNYSSLQSQLFFLQLGHQAYFVLLMLLLWCC